MRTILITGFGRFPGSPLNPSGIVATRLAKRRRPALLGARRVAHVFATRYDAVDRDLPVLLAQEKPDIVVMFGVATRSRLVRIEERARNRIALFPDAGRRRPATQTIALHREALRNRLPLARLVTAARAAGIAAARSHNAGSYLCNYIYWRGLEAAARPDGPQAVIFVHVPPVAAKAVPKKPAGRLNMKRPVPAKPFKIMPFKTRPLKRLSAGSGTQSGRPAAGIDDLVRAGEAIVLAVTSLGLPRPHRDGSPAPAPDRDLPAPVHTAAAAPAARDGHFTQRGPQANPIRKLLTKIFQTVRRRR